MMTLSRIWISKEKCPPCWVLGCRGWRSNLSLWSVRGVIFSLWNPKGNMSRVCTGAQSLYILDSTQEEMTEAELTKISLQANGSKIDPRYIRRVKEEAPGLVAQNHPYGTPRSNQVHSAKGAPLDQQLTATITAASTDRPEHNPHDQIPFLVNLENSLLQ